MYLPLSDPQAPSPDIMINGNVMPKCTSFKYLGSIINKAGSCDEDVNHRISVAWLKWRESSGVLCDKRMPPKLKGKIYTTVVRPALIYGSKCWTMYENFGRGLTTVEMKMCRMSLGVTKLDRIISTYQHIRGTLNIKETIVDKVRGMTGSLKSILTVKTMLQEKSFRWTSLRCVKGEDRNTVGLA